MITVKHTTPNSPLKAKVRKFTQRCEAINYVNQFRHSYGCSWPFEVTVKEFKFEARPYKTDWYVTGPKQGLTAKDIGQAFELMDFINENCKGA